MKNVNLLKTSESFTAAGVDMFSEVVSKKVSKGNENNVSWDGDTWTVSVQERKTGCATNDISAMHESQISGTQGIGFEVSTFNED